MRVTSRIWLRFLVFLFIVLTHEHDATGNVPECPRCKARISYIFMCWDKKVDLRIYSATIVCGTSRQYFDAYCICQLIWMNDEKTRNCTMCMKILVQIARGEYRRQYNTHTKTRIQRYESNEKNNLEFFRIKANVWSAWRTILLLLLSCLYIWRYEIKTKNTRSKTVTITTNFTQCTHGSAYARHRTRVQTNDDEVSTHVYASAQQYNKTIAQKHKNKNSKMHWILYADCILLCNIKKK